MKISKSATPKVALVYIFIMFIFLIPLISVDNSAISVDKPSEEVLVAANGMQNYVMKPGIHYEWIEPFGGTELVTWSDNGYFSYRYLPFYFPFYDTDFYYVHIAANGYLSFVDSSPSDSTYDGFPSASWDNNYMIAIYWDDLRTDEAGAVSGDIYIESFIDHWVVTWYRLEEDAGNVVVGSFQIVLYSNGDIVFNFNNIAYLSGGYGCGINYGQDLAYYNEYTGLTTSTSNFSIEFTQPKIGSGGANYSETGQTVDYFGKIGAIALLIIGTLAIAAFLIKKGGYSRSRMSD